MALGKSPIWNYLSQLNFDFMSPTVVLNLLAGIHISFLIILVMMLLGGYNDSHLMNEETKSSRSYLTAQRQLANKWEKENWNLPFPVLQAYLGGTDSVSEFNDSL